MSRKINFALAAIIVFAGVQPVFAQFELPEPEYREPLFFSIAILAAAGDSDASPSIPQSIRNNQYYRESLRLAKLAQDTYDYGDYDSSSSFAQEAIRYAQLSDEYVALQLKIKETNDAIASAKQRLDWANSSGAAKQYPIEYSEAETFYDTSLTDRAAEQWDAAIDNANRVVDILAYIQAPSGTPPPGVPPAQNLNLPAQYTVRTWTSFKDCLWNIASRSWAYSDPFKWKLIYEANKSKLPEAGNPDLIEPGMVLDIPSIKGETRQGMWDSGKTYNP